MLTLPAKMRRRKQPYLSLRSQLLARNIRRAGIVFYTELMDFMKQNNIGGFGPGFLRYLCIGRNGEMDLEFGYFTERLYAGGGPVRSGLLPSGLFVSARWNGPYENLNEAEAMVTGWANYNNVSLDATETDGGTSYGCRMAIFHVSPKHTPDAHKLVTEIAILTRPAGRAK